MNQTQQTIRRHNNPVMWVLLGFMVAEIINAVFNGNCPAFEWINHVR